MARAAPTVATLTISDGRTAAHNEGGPVVAMVCSGDDLRALQGHATPIPLACPRAFEMRVSVTSQDASSSRARHWSDEGAI